MNELLFSFECYKGYTIAVTEEPYEWVGVAYIHAHQNPICVVTGKDPEAVRLECVQMVDDITEYQND